MTGVAFSAAGGVVGGGAALEVSTRVACESLRRRSETVDGLGSCSASLTGSRSGLDAFEADVGRAAVWLASGRGFLSGLGLPVPVELLLDLNTSRNRPPGDGERRAREAGAVRPVWLVARRGVESRLSVLVLVTGKVAAERGEGWDEGVPDGCDGCVSGW